MSRKIFYRISWKLQSLIVPELKYSQAIFEAILNEKCQEGYIWLDLGCGHNLLSPWRLEQEITLSEKPRLLVGIDYDIYSLKKHKTIINKVCGDITKLPFLDNSFDLITSNMVFEHLYNPKIQLKEITRILKTGGKLIFHTPNIHGYTTIMARIIPKFIKNRLIKIVEGRQQNDVFPTYYKINSRSTIAMLANESRLEIIDVKMICSSPQFIFLPLFLIPELLWIKLLMTKYMKALRTNIIAILEKPSDRS